MADKLFNVTAVCTVLERAMAEVVAPAAAMVIAVMMAAVMPKSLFCLNNVNGLGASTGMGIYPGMRVRTATG